MTPEQVFALVATERRRAADFFADLDEAQLATPSLCGAWTVKEVLAHLTAPFSVSMTGAFLGVLRHRLSFDRYNAALAQELGTRPTAELLAALRENATSRFTPPGLGPEAPLTDLAVHTRDAARPLGLPHQVSADAWRVVLTFLVSPKAQRSFVPKSRLSGLRLVVTDLDGAHGAGAEVRGTAEALALILTGRMAALDDLSGPGVDLLRSRL